MIHPSIRRSCFRRCALALSLALAAAAPGAVRAQDAATPAPLASPTPEPSPSPAAKPAPSPEARQRSGSGSLSAADEKTLAGYHLDINRINLYGALTKQLTTLGKTDPELRKELRAFGPANRSAAIEDKVTAFSSQCPRATAAITAVKTADGSAYTVRDYLLTGYSLTNAMSAASARRASPGWTRPSYIPADNVQIAEQNQSMLETMLHDLAKSARE